MSTSDTNFEDVPGYTVGLDTFGGIRVYNDQVLLGSGTGSVEERSRRASAMFGIEISNPSKFFELSRAGEIERGPVLLSKLEVSPADLLDTVTFLNFAVATLINDDYAEVDFNAFSGVKAMSNPDVFTAWTEVIVNYLSDGADNSTAEAEESKSNAPATVDSGGASRTAANSRTTGRAPRRARRPFPIALPGSSGARTSSSAAPVDWPIDSPTQDVQTRLLSIPFNRDAAGTASPSLDTLCEKFIASYTASAQAFQQNLQASSRTPAQVPPEAEATHSLMGLMMTPRMKPPRLVARKTTSEHNWRSS